MMIDNIIEILESYAFSTHDEKFLQNEIAEVFEIENIPFKKEVALSRGIIDFMVGDIGIEVKIKQQPVSVYRQLERYVEDERVKQIILATVKPIYLPDNINGKTSRYAIMRGGGF